MRRFTRRARFLPPSRIDGATVRGSLISDGCTIEEGATIENSVVGLRCRIGRNVHDPQLDPDGRRLLRYRSPERGRPGRRLPAWASAPARVIEGAIIDKNCRIGGRVRIANDRRCETSPETPEAMIADGIIIVQKDAVLPDGWQLADAAVAACQSGARGRDCPPSRRLLA